MNVFLNALAKGVSSASPRAVSRLHVTDALQRVHFPEPQTLSSTASRGRSGISMSFSEARDPGDIAYAEQPPGAQNGWVKAGRGSGGQMEDIGTIFP